MSEWRNPTWKDRAIEAESAAADFRLRVQAQAEEIERLNEQLAREIELCIEDEPRAVVRLSEEIERLQAAIEIAARDDCGPATTKRILRHALAGAAPREETWTLAPGQDAADPANEVPHFERCNAPFSGFANCVLPKGHEGRHAHGSVVLPSEEHPD
jgi:hypothetical protein